MAVAQGVASLSPPEVLPLLGVCQRCSSRDLLETAEQSLSWKTTLSLKCQPLSGAKERKDGWERVGMNICEWTQVMVLHITVG